jgi:hypothetical protein
MRKADLQLLAAAKGIDAIGLSVNLMRLKLAGWEATQLSGPRSFYPSVEPPMETSAMLVLSDDDEEMTPFDSTSLLGWASDSDCLKSVELEAPDASRI